MDRILDQIRSQTHVDLYGLVATIRRYRASMVPTLVGLFTNVTHDLYSNKLNLEASTYNRSTFGRYPVFVFLFQLELLLLRIHFDLNLLNQLWSSFQLKQFADKTH